MLIGALISGFYTDRFGRKNAIIVWLGIQTIILAGLSFMPNIIGFMILRTLCTATNVSFWYRFLFNNFGEFCHISIWHKI